MPFLLCCLLNCFCSVCLCRDVFLTRSNLEVLRMFILCHMVQASKPRSCVIICNGAARSSPSSSSLSKLTFLSLSLSFWVNTLSPSVLGARLFQSVLSSTFIVHIIHVIVIFEYVVVKQLYDCFPFI